MQVEHVDKKYEALVSEVQALQQQLENSEMTAENLRKELMDLVEEREKEGQEMNHVEQMLQVNV